jgi:carbon monoxide dehydrogenase subunit G
MKLENSFSVAAPVEETWKTLLDIERVANCLPGARIEPSEEDGVYRGAMKVKLGPMTVDYRGTARFQDVDEDTHTASIAVQAREAKGQGTAAAVIENRLESQNGGTRVTAITDLKITGRQAQFGRGIMEDVANAMMGEFAKRLEQEIQTGGATDDAAARGPAVQSSRRAAAAADPAPGSGASSDEPEALDLGNVLSQTAAVRYAGIGAVVLLVLGVLLAVLRGQRRDLTINLNVRR